MLRKKYGGKRWISLKGKKINNMKKILKCENYEKKKKLLLNYCC